MGELKPWAIVIALGVGLMGWMGNELWSTQKKMATLPEAIQKLPERLAAAETQITQLETATSNQAVALVAHYDVDAHKGAYIAIERVAAEILAKRDKRLDEVMGRIDDRLLPKPLESALKLFDLLKGAS